MGWKELGKSITSMGASLLGNAVAGPMGGQLAGNLVAKLWGADPEDPADIYAKMTADPDAAIKLRELQNRHEERLEELAIERVKIGYADVASARRMHVETTKATGKRDINLYVLAYGFVVGFFVSIIVMMVLVLKGKLPEAMPQYVTFLLGSLFGTLTAGVTAIIQFFFGSSKGSKDKDEKLEGYLAQAGTK
jgi:uncharacterized membrane-anchored protein YitT (DUF2179 family)